MEITTKRTYFCLKRKAFPAKARFVILHQRALRRDLDYACHSAGLNDSRSQKRLSMLTQ